MFSRNLVKEFLFISLVLWMPVFGLPQDVKADSLVQDSTQTLENIMENPSTESINVDSLFTVAKKAAFELKDFKSAIDLCESILTQEPENYDNRIFLGRLYAWTGQYDQSIALLKMVVHEQKYFDDARSALVDVYSWNKQFSEALEVIRVGLEENPLNSDLYYKKAICLRSLSEPQAAQIALQNLMRLDPGHVQGRSMLDSFSKAESLRKITVAYNYNRLADTRTQWQALVGAVSMDPWHLMTIEGAQTFDFGPIIARYSLARRFQQVGMQFELESYPNIRKGTYAYIGLGYSGTELFPVARFGAELFQNLPRDYEISLGSRFLHLEYEDIIMYTGSLGKYIGNYWFNLRSFLVPGASASTFAWNLVSRRYLKDAETYLEVNLSQGESPDLNPGVAELAYLGSWRLAVQFQRKLDEVNLLKSGFSLANIEVRENAYRGDTGFFLSYSRRF